MYELYPYFTNDGSVGLFSQQDDDIYHSTHGALSESWQKFIIPSHLEEYLSTHKKVKILDICYGIGYNTKTSLNLFVKQILEKNKKIKTEKNIYKKISKNVTPSVSNIASIDTDNNNHEDNTNNLVQDDKNIYDDNFFCDEFLLDAVDLDKTLMKLSPFISDVPKINLMPRMNNEFCIEHKLKYKQIKNIKKFKKNIKNEFRLKNEVSIILLNKLLEINSNIFDDSILQTILHHKKYNPFLSNFMLNFVEFYQNQGYNYNKNKNNLASLHNIYYGYISKSYKNAKKILETSKIDINFVVDDARKFIRSNDNSYNFIFLDAFTPSKCPALWTVQFFNELYKKLDYDGMILTYSNSAAVRNAFLQNGFSVGKIYDNEFKKFVGTVATKDPNLIEHNLDSRDLDLINSKAGICFQDAYLNFDNNTIIENRKVEVSESDLNSSSMVLKGYKSGDIKSL